MLPQNMNGNRRSCNCIYILFPRAGAGYVEIVDTVVLPTDRAKAIPAEEPIAWLTITANAYEQGRRWRALRTSRNNSTEVAIQDSIDLNPIENLWAQMVTEWKETSVRTVEGVMRHCYEIWESLRRKKPILLRAPGWCPAWQNSCSSCHRGKMHAPGTNQEMQNNAMFTSSSEV